MIPVAILASALAATLWPAGVAARLQHPGPFHEDDDEDDEDERPIGDPDEDDGDEDDEDDEEEPWQVRRARGSLDASPTPSLQRLDRPQLRIRPIR